MSTEASRYCCSLFAVLALSTAALGQAPAMQTPPPPAAPPMDVLPAPHGALPPPVEFETEAWDTLPHASGPAGSAIWAVGAPHLVLRRHASATPASHERAVLSSHAAGHRQHVAGSRPPLPAATTLHLQKTPYSYGYFGAQGRRHWSLHYGHQQNYTQWTKR